jgi:hypothetical protein
MKLAAAIFSVLLHWGQAPAPIDEPGETRAEFELRMDTATASVVAVAHEPSKLFVLRKVFAVAGILTVWHFESHLALEVHNGTKRGDGGKANCMGSIHASALVPDWSQLSGTDLDATTRCARATLRVLRSSWWECAHGRDIDEQSLAETLEQYATGHTCAPGAESRKRARFWMRLTRRLS